MRNLLILSAVSAVSVLAGCGNATTLHVAGRPGSVAGVPAGARTDNALGRVVVYRNGVAYFERTAHVEGDSLKLMVPGDKVDDFLDSLTVVDARTGKAAPVLYPSDTKAATGSSPVEMKIQLQGKGPHELRLAYVTESPSWKPSYRVVMRSDGELELEGWAIVDNTSGEDWNGVRLGVGSSAAQSFRFDLRSLRNVARGTLAATGGFALPPPVATPNAASMEGGGAGPDASADPDSLPVGTALFLSPEPMTVPRGSSAMVSVMNERTKGEIAYLYDPASTATDPAYPPRGIRIKNPTESVLDSGPLSLFGQERFIGEGLCEAIPAHATAFIPFALDRQIFVESEQTTADTIAKIVAVKRGVLQTEKRRALHTAIKVKNRLGESAVVYVKHKVEDGYHLSSSVTNAEHLGDAQVFRVVVAPYGEAEVPIEEELAVEESVDLRTAGALELVDAFLKTDTASPLRTRVEALLDTEKSIHDDQLRGAALREEAAEARARSAELKAQIAALKTTHGGEGLARELTKKADEATALAKKALDDNAALSDKLVLANIGVEDALAELTLDVPADSATASR